MKNYSSMRAKYAAMEKDLAHYKALAEQTTKDLTIEYLLTSAETLLDAANLLISIRAGKGGSHE